ncbi:MAG: hypothetical protein FWG03_04845 [Clostridiales bacterium]|nr:hypothetical protein [Clostridiales bacterium]
MKAKLWERTAFRIILFLLCVIFSAGSFALILAGSGKRVEFEVKQEGQVPFLEADAFRAGGFVESDTFSHMALTRMSMLLEMHRVYADEGGGIIDFANGEDQICEDAIRAIFNEMKRYIIEKSLPYEEYLTFYEQQLESELGDIGRLRQFGYDWDIEGIFYWYDHSNTMHVMFDSRLMEDDPVIGGGDLRNTSIDDPGVREAFEALYAEPLEGLRMDFMKGLREDLDYYTKILGAVYYYVSDGPAWLSNIEVDDAGVPVDISKVTGQPVWVKLERGDCTSEPPGLLRGMVAWDDYSNAKTAYIGWTAEQLAYYENLYNQARNIIWIYYIGAAGLLVAAVVLLVLLIVFTGRKRPAFENTRRLWALDNIFVEFQLVALAILFSVGVNALSWFLDGYNHGWIAGATLYYVLFCAAGFALSAGLLWFLLSLVRVIKAGLFVKRSLIGLLVAGPCAALGRAIKSGFDGRNPLAKSLILIILLWFVTAAFAGLGGILATHGGGALLFYGFLLVLVLVGAILFTYKWVERYRRLRKGVEEIAGGNLSYKIEISGDGKNEFDRLSAFVNELGSAQNAALQSELKNQRLKTDLISNVSHDLKTPLTSILTYTDLLKTEGLKSGNAGEYLKVIDEKGQRLKKLTDDLFEAAKASSGALNVRKEKVDLLELLEQEIAEMNGSFAEAGLELIVEAPDEHYFVEADSQLLWRVVDNLLRNARKYAQPGTRVYIELKERLPGYHAGLAGQAGSAGQAGHAGQVGHAGQAGFASQAGHAGQAGFAGQAGDGRSGAAYGGATHGGAVHGGAAYGGVPLMTTFEIKNISAIKLNIPPEELMERFKRGDESRATDGSGLGLAIAKDLVRLQNGWFEISIDGDLFKAVVMLPQYTA